MDTDVDFDGDIDQLKCHTSTILKKYFKLDSSYWVGGDTEYAPNHFLVFSHHEKISCTPDGIPDEMPAHLCMEFLD